MAACLISMRLIHILVILSHRMIEDSGKRGNTMAERRQLFAEMSKYETLKPIECSWKDLEIKLNPYGICSFP